MRSCNGTTFRSPLEFNTYRIDQRPAFVLRSAIGDTAILSGLYRLEPLTADQELRT
ncbi:MAG TPA: hypothetical protein VE154_06750 [Chthoniobacterales bacterium]|nr:hypothetical protein [Chthoniobacterales bacterium]